MVLFSKEISRPATIVKIVFVNKWKKDFASIRKHLLIDEIDSFGGKLLSSQQKGREQNKRNDDTNDDYESTELRMLSSEHPEKFLEGIFMLQKVAL